VAASKGALLTAMGPAQWRPAKLPTNFICLSGHHLLFDSSGCWKHLGRFFREQIGDGHRFVAGWAQSTRTYPPAKASTIGAVLVTEVAVVAGGALVDGVVSECASWDRRKRSRVTTPPRRLAASWLTEALSANRREPGPANRTWRHRLAVVP